MIYTEPTNHPFELHHREGITLEGLVPMLGRVSISEIVPRLSVEVKRERAARRMVEMAL